MGCPESGLHSREARKLLASDVFNTRQPPTNDQSEGRSCVAIITQTGFKIGSTMVISVASRALTSRMALEYSKYGTPSDTEPSRISQIPFCPSLPSVNIQGLATRTVSG
jgi:hypothetical protein